MSVYLYCIARAASLTEPPPAPARGLVGGGESLRLIEREDLVALVGDVPEGEIQPSRRNLRAHEQVVEGAMERSDVLPVRFGLVAGDDGAVRDGLLAREHDNLARALERVRGRVSVVVKVSWDERPLFEELRRDHPELADRGRQASLSLDDKIELGRLVDQEIARRREEEAISLLTTLQPLAVEALVLDPTAELMILHASFLIERGNLKAFDEKLEEIGKRSGGRLLFKYVGPLAPYDFVDLHITDLEKTTRRAPVGVEAPHA